MDRGGDSQLVCQQVDLDQVRDVLASLHERVGKQHLVTDEGVESPSDDDDSDEEWERQRELRQSCWRARLDGLRTGRRKLLGSNEEYDCLSDVTVVLIEEAIQLMNEQMCDLPDRALDAVDTAATVVANAGGTLHIAWDLVIDVRRALFGAGAVRKDALVPFRDKVRRRVMSYELVGKETARVVNGLRSRQKRARQRRAFDRDDVMIVVEQLL